MKVTETVNVEINAKEALAVLADYVESRGYSVASIHFDYGCTGCGQSGDEYADHELTVQAAVEKIKPAPRRKAKR